MKLSSRSSEAQPTTKNCFKFFDNRLSSLVIDRPCFHPREIDFETEIDFFLQNRRKKLL